MTLATFLSLYLTTNFLVAIAFMGLALHAFVQQALRRSIASRVELKLHYAVLTIVLVFSATQPFLPRSQVFTPPAKIWAAQSAKSFSHDYAGSSTSGFLSIPTPMGNSVVQTNVVSIASLALALLLLVFGCLRLGRDFLFLSRIKRSSFCIRSIGQVHLFVSDQVKIPFSYWVPGQANIVLPSALLSCPQDLRMAVAHELQHHRQRDTRWVYVLYFMRLIYVLNPAIYFWNRWISEIQEFACDETLVDQGKVKSQAYARCLVEVAQTAIDRDREPVCATGLTFLVERNILKRRIEKMLAVNVNKKRRRWAGVGIGLVMASILGATTWASTSLVQDRRVTLPQANAMAVRAQSQSNFPIVVNDLVLKQLNRFIGTPEGREYMRKALANMEHYRVLIEEKLREYSMPMEILAVPIIESAYQNLRFENRARARGLWQFIPSTARNYGLRVDDKIDERLDVDLSTDAALRYLLSNHLRFKDWLLAALAYNAGEDAVQKGVTALGTRDAWTLIRNGYEGDKDYLAKLVAAVLIMHSPDSVQ